MKLIIFFMIMKLCIDNKIWSYPGNDLSKNSICCMPEKKNKQFL